MNPKIIFFGTPNFASKILESLIEKKFDIAAVFSQPDKKIGRKQELVFSPVKKLAIENKIKVFQPDNLRDESVSNEIKKINPDLFVVAAYGKILPKSVLDLPKYGAINIHASLLPKYRGASPIQCAILAGEKETGITLMAMNEKMDEGDILRQKKMAIGEDETADKLAEKLAASGAVMISEFIPDWVSGKIKPVPQASNRATYCEPIKREDGKINWESDAQEIYRTWRAYQPWPGIFSDIRIKGQTKRLKLLEIEAMPAEKTGQKSGKILEYNQGVAVQAGKGLIILKKVQLEGKKESGIEDFVRGYPELVGSRLE